MKFIIVLVLLGILGALASAGVLMLRKRPPEAGTAGQPDKRMARALALRVGLSVALFLFILFSYWMGWIQPTGLPVAR
ncbi:twin transmembrane helix small protein [Azohydromonas lata]|uniref:Twin transmembrane helix small protein n=1 Tax=Azohydromonas lata TaxID=45677 RepID=A0ABU5IBL7_9BURK|nr:twin transmembrane helix small protein [Azohydromonas lata]MDZ5456484.1 twin transmembrane helix small protein [Azohydromonas lata]